MVKKNREKDKNEFNKAGFANSQEEPYKTPYPRENRIYKAMTSIIILKEKSVSKKLKNSIKRKKFDANDSNVYAKST
jgi:hypothetical protein